MQPPSCQPDQHKRVDSRVVARLNRLRRIEGQVRGVHRMVEEGRSCLEVVTQLQAVSAAAKRVADEMIEAHIRGLVADAINERQGNEETTELMQVLDRALKR